MKEDIYNFLSKYMETTQAPEDIDIKDAIDNVNSIWLELPKHAQSKERKDFYDEVARSVIHALDSVLRKVASCPFIKIEITSQPGTTSLQNDFDKSHKYNLANAGYIMAHLDEVDRKITSFEKNFHANIGYLDARLDRMIDALEKNESPRVYIDLSDKSEAQQ